MTQNILGPRLRGDDNDELIFDGIISQISLLKPNDVLILAGKGHEKYQIIGDEKMAFDEEKIVQEILY